MTQTKIAFLEKIVGKLAKQVDSLRKLESEGFRLVQVIESENGVLDLPVDSISRSISYGIREIRIVDGHRVFKDVLDPGTYLIYYKP